MNFIAKNVSHFPMRDTLRSADGVEFSLVPSTSTRGWI